MEIKTNHIGKNISRVRALRGIKQEALAMDLKKSQAEISNIEQQAEIADDLLEKIAFALNVTSDVLRNFDESAAFYTINNNVENNTFNESSTAIQQEFNPVHKIIELYERLLASEREKLILLQNSQSK
jgi:transcriptional regulator with XRE-family HTH domain